MREEKTPHNLLYKRHPAVKTVGRLLEKVLLYNKMLSKKILLDKLQRLGYYFICNEARPRRKKRQPRNSYISREAAAEIFLPPLRIRIFRIIVVIIRSELVIYILL